ncbi:MAG: hypothetical protein ISS57_04015 [Anaerolineales bacterium]|nr:hypothetical protein [Anaerolineales bacterium]
MIDITKQVDYWKTGGEKDIEIAERFINRDKESLYFEQAQEVIEWLINQL